MSGRGIAATLLARLCQEYLRQLIFCGSPHPIFGSRRYSWQRRVSRLKPLGGSSRPVNNTIYNWWQSATVYCLSLRTLGRIPQTWCVVHEEQVIAWVHLGEL